MAALLNGIGLVLNIIGVLILFEYGFPQPDFNESTGLAVEGPTADKNAEDTRRLKCKYLCRSQMARTLIITGFLFQLFALVA
jgi:hypothetical protein